MSIDPRDTHFAGFAKMLYEEVQDMACSFREFPGSDVLKQRECEIIAQRAYDLVLHTVTEVSIRDLDSLHLYETTERIPDLTHANIVELDMFRRKSEKELEK